MNTLVILILTVSALTVDARKYTDKFMDYGVYAIKNRALDKQLLTFINDRLDAKGKPLMVSPEMQFAGTDKEGWGQRWRLDKSALYTAFELRPILNENYVLEHYPDQGILRWLSGFGNTKLWYLQDAGDDFTLVKHKKYDLCLQVQKNNATVIAQECTGSIFQQWQFDKE